MKFSSYAEKVNLLYVSKPAVKERLSMKVNDSVVFFIMVMRGIPQIGLFLQYA